MDRLSTIESKPRQTKKIVSTIRHHWLTFAFIGGFITDLILLNRVDDLIDNLILLFYVVLATISLILLYAGLAERFGDVWSVRVRMLVPLAMQYSFGGLFSGMLIFYGQSGDIFASWPFLLLIVGAIYGNEVIRRRGQKLVFNLLAYFIGVFSYLVLVIPVLTGYMGGWVFLGSGLLALVVVYFVIQLLTLIIPNFMLLQMRQLVFVILGTFVMLNGLYLMNIIPPIPLSLKEIVIAHSVVRFGDEYEITYEEAPWWQVWQRVHSNFHPATSGSVACFTRVFAPTKIKTEIYHVWEYKNKETGKWQEYFRLAYPITGAGEDGYRGYTAIGNFQDGEWRCSVETARGQIVGRQAFSIDSSVEPENLVKRVD